MENNEAFAALVKKSPGYLDRPIEELVKMQTVGSVFLDTHRSILRKIKAGQIELAEEDRRGRLVEGQAIGEALLDVERRIGELVDQEPPVKPAPIHEKGYSGARGFAPSGKPPKHKRMGMKRNQMETAQAIARHPEAVARVIAEAKENEDIPTKTAVLAKIRQQRAEEALAKAKKEAVKEKVQAEPRRMARYFEAVKVYGSELEIALEAAKQKSFSPESIHLLKKKHEVLRGLMEKLEAAV